MVVIGGPTSEIEVRLRKITGTGDNLDPIYFDEYASTSEREPQDNLRKERCIVPEDINYAIEVVFKKGFTIGKYDAEWCIYVRDLSSKTRLFIKWFCFHPHFKERSHKEDQIFEFSSVPQALVNGEVREDVELSFRRLVPDETLDPGIRKDGATSKQKRGLKVVVCRVSKKRSEPIPQKTLDDRGTLSAAPHSKPLKLHATAKYQESHHYYFVLRTADYIEHNGFRKAPVLLEMSSWNVLNYQEKQRCFKVLQERVTYFEKGETPPEDLPQSETNRQSPPVAVKEEEMGPPNSHAPTIIDLDSDSENDPIRAAPSAPNTIRAKAAQVVKPTLSDTGGTLQSPIDLEGYRPSTSLQQWMPRTIKGEPVDRSLFVSPPPILCNEEEFVKVKSEIRAAKTTVALKREYDESATETLEKLKREKE
ncbi:hypothetical protein HYALB_00005960 [Hymenoscyphus albidus]|uniref:Uncharacterized protein n=1 Tax=Hymenoscyphus albidus TaxID=595503 RepID=A0A9N9Q1F9_9HELO|nr:hypothetical protein HYALB_00005960 [Hymenoscyphus albidus]